MVSVTCAHSSRHHRLAYKQRDSELLDPTFRVALERDWSNTTPSETTSLPLHNHVICPSRCYSLSTIRFHKWPSQPLVGVHDCYPYPGGQGGCHVAGLPAVATVHCHNALHGIELFLCVLRSAACFVRLYAWAGWFSHSVREWKQAQRT